MTNDNSIIALVDKQYPPDHSFIDGMLAKVVANEPRLRINILTSRAEGSCGNETPKKYYGAVCIPALLPRRSVQRFLNLCKAAELIRRLSRRESSKGRNVVVFVRNSPIFLLAAHLMSTSFDRLIFQSSHPHEEMNSNYFKRVGARSIFRISSSSVDAVLGVSPIGLKRLWRHFPNAEEGAYIPLLSDVPPNIEINTRRDSKLEEGIRFIYAGSHKPRRRIDLILRAIVEAVECHNIDGSFCFVGGTSEEIQKLKGVEGVSRLITDGTIEFTERVDRSQVFEMYNKAEVGLSVAPPSETNREMSPTKLSEYMIAGLAVVATKGIPMQEHFVRESQGGVLVGWSKEEIKNSIVNISKDKDRLFRMMRKSYRYASKELVYEKYVQDIKRLIGDK